MSQADVTTPVLGAPTLGVASSVPLPCAPSEQPAEDELTDEDFDYVSVPPTIIGHIKVRFHEIGELPAMPMPTDEDD